MSIENLPQAPYPADTRAKGWRFELDHERIRQSDTWALAPAEIKPWLLMLWMTAWEQVPCASLPNDDCLIVARIGMSPELFSMHRAVLMRGWWRANDGRLYHTILVDRVMEMLDRKNNERERKAAYRARMDAERAALAKSAATANEYVPSVSHGTDAGLTRHSLCCDATGTGTGTGIKTKSKTKTARDARGDAQAHLESLGVDPAVARDWLALRASKRLKPTETALAGVVAEAERAGMTLDAALRLCCLRGWGGFEAGWVSRGPPAKPPRSYHDDRAATIAGLTGSSRREHERDDRTVDVPATRID